MILNFGDYIFDDGIRGIFDEKPKMINVPQTTTKDYFSVLKREKKFSDILNNRDDYYNQFAFNEQYYNSLLHKGKLQDAVDYISRYKPVDEEQRKIFEADVASLRQQAKHENSFRSGLTEDEINRYDFYNNVFEDRAFDFMQDNPYVRKFESIKKQLGSLTSFDKDGNVVIDKEATGLRMFFPNTKRINKYVSWLGIDKLSDALQADTHNGINEFLEYANLDKSQLKGLGIEIEYDKAGSSYLSFSKANSLANKLIYDYYDFYTHNWDEYEMGSHYNPYIAGLDSDGNIVNEGFIYDPTEDNKFYSNDVLYKAVSSIANRFEPGDYATNRAFKNNMRTFASMINENKGISEKLEETKGSQDYSSIESNFVSDAMQKYLSEAKANGYTQEQTLAGIKYIHAQDVDMVTKAMQQSGHDFYTSYFNPNENDDTLVQTQDPDEIKDIIKILNEADPNDVSLNILVSNGIIGTKISVQKKSEKKGETILGSNRGLQVWIPNLFTEEAQKRLNEQPESRAVLELNTMLYTNDKYVLDNGSKISAAKDDSGITHYYLEEGKIDIRLRNAQKYDYNSKVEITKEEAMGHIVKDIYTQKAIDAQFTEQIAPNGNIINVEDYDRAAKEKALTIAQTMYKGTDDLVKTDGTLITLDEIFTKQINRNNVSPYVYNKVKVIYDIYDRLMSELYSYEDFQDALLSMGKIRYNYSANS